jgi:hypothetical protein
LDLGSWVSPQGEDPPVFRKLDDAGAPELVRVGEDVGRDAVGADPAEEGDEVGQLEFEEIVSGKHHEVAVDFGLGYGQAQVGQSAEPVLVVGGAVVEAVFSWGRRGGPGILMRQ